MHVCQNKALGCPSHHRCPMTVTQNIRPISCLGNATGKKFNIYFCLLQQQDLKRELFLQMGLQERGYSDLGYTSPDT